MVRDSRRYWRRSLAAAGLDYCHRSAAQRSYQRDLPELTDAIELKPRHADRQGRHAHQADIGRALDLGCDGVIVPSNVDSAQQAEVVVGACRYPPVGYRSAGRGRHCGAGEAALHRHGRVEGKAVAELEATLALTGVDGIYVELDLSVLAQLRPGRRTQYPGQAEQIWATCAAGKQAEVGDARIGGRQLAHRDMLTLRLVTMAVDGPAIARTAVAELAVARD